MGGCWTREKNNVPVIPSSKIQKDIDPEALDEILISTFNINDYRDVKSSNELFAFLARKEKFANLAHVFQQSTSGLLGPAYIFPYSPNPNKNMIVFHKDLQNFEPSEHQYVYQDCPVMLEREKPTSFIQNLNQLNNTNVIMGYFSMYTPNTIIFFTKKRSIKNSESDYQLLKINNGFSSKNLEEIFETAAKMKLKYKFCVEHSSGITGVIWLLFERSAKKITYFMIDVTSTIRASNLYQSKLSTTLTKELDNKVFYQFVYILIIAVVVCKFLWIFGKL